MREIKFRACDDRKHYAPIMLDFEQRVHYTKRNQNDKNY